LIVRKHFFPILAMWLAAVISGTLFGAEAKTDLPIVVCLGDSITRRGYPELLPDLIPVRAINAGVNGNTSKQGLARLQRDVLNHHPDFVVLFFGANDSRMDKPQPLVSVDHFETNLLTIVTRCQQAGAKVLLGTMPPITPEPYFTRHPKTNYDAAGGIEKHLATYRAAARKVADVTHASFIDLSSQLAKTPQWVSEDGVHPTPEGNRIIAGLIADKLRPMLKR
jgi:lysophospholipase L1-like esterase